MRPVPPEIIYHVLILSPYKEIVLARVVSPTTSHPLSNNSYLILNFFFSASFLAVLLFKQICKAWKTFVEEFKMLEYT